MAGTRRQFNWQAVSYTPAGGTLVAITGVTSIDVDPNGSVQKFSGDGDRFPTTIVSDFIDNLITITSGDLQAIRSLDPGTFGALAMLHKDAKKTANTAEAGDIAYAITSPRAMIQNNPTGGQHKQFGSGRLLICMESPDGVTNPLASTVTAA